MGLRDRIRRRLRPSPPVEPTPAVQPPEWRGAPQPERFSLDPERVVPQGLSETLRELDSLPRPLLVVHWASWDEASVAALGALREILEALPALQVRGLGWDRLREAPTGRIPGMAQRPARWSDGSDLQAHHLALGLRFRSTLLTDPSAELAQAVPCDPFVLPRLELYASAGQDPRVHAGPLAGPGWDALLVAARGLTHAGPD